VLSQWYGTTRQPRGSYHSTKRIPRNPIVTVKTAASSLPRRCGCCGCCGRFDLYAANVAAAGRGWWRGRRRGGQGRVPHRRALQIILCWARRRCGVAVRAVAGVVSVPYWRVSRAGGCVASAGGSGLSRATSVGRCRQLKRVIAPSHVTIRLPVGCAAWLQPWWFHPRLDISSSSTGAMLARRWPACPPVQRAAASHARLSQHSSTCCLAYPTSASSTKWCWQPIHRCRPSARQRGPSVPALHTRSPAKQPSSLAPPPCACAVLAVLPPVRLLALRAAVAHRLAASAHPQLVLLAVLLAADGADPRLLRR
jgi:hypothetical protein